MLDVIVYNRIEEKNQLESAMPLKLSPQEAFIHTLEMMDFLMAFSPTKSTPDNSGIDWIVLEIERK